MPVLLVPMAEPCQNDDACQSGEREPGKAALSAWQYYERGREWAERRAEVAADLKQGLSEAVRAARSEASDARGFRVEDRGSHPKQHRADKQHGIAWREGDRQQPGHRRSHAERQRIRHRTAVGVMTEERLKQRGCQLIDEGQKSN